MAKPESKEAVFYHVYDQNQRGKEPRKHDVIIKLEKAVDGTVTNVDYVTYDLYSDKPCKMQMEHALKFLCDPAFKVVNTDGNRVEPVAKFDPSKPITKLADDEIVCKNVELSHESLLRRVKVLPGSEAVSANSTIEELAAFLTAWNRSKRGLSDGERALAEKIASGDLTSDALSPEMAERLMPKSPLLDRVAA